MSGSVNRPPGSIDPERPDAGFNDDHVGGHAKLDEERAQRMRQNAGRYITPKRIETEAKQVGSAAAFRAPHREAASDALERDARRRIAARGEALAPQHEAQPPVRRDARMVRLERIEQRLTLLLGSMVRVQRQLTELDGQTAAGAEDIDEAFVQALLEEDEVDDEQHDADSDAQSHEGDAQSAPDHDEKKEPPPKAQLARRLVLLEQAAKFQLQLLIGGGHGLTLMNDPLLTFERLFDQIADWPQSVRPGYRPTNAAEVDLFLAWVFEPAGEPGDIELLAALSAK